MSRQVRTCFKFVKWLTETQLIPAELNHTSWNWKMELCLEAGDGPSFVIPPPPHFLFYYLSANVNVNHRRSAICNNVQFNSANHPLSKNPLPILLALFLLLYNVSCISELVHNIAYISRYNCTYQSPEFKL
jgi:hypothetical protein